MAGPNTLGVATDQPTLTKLTVNGNSTIGAAATDTVAFYGATGQTQPTSSAQGVTGVVSLGTLSATVWGFSCSAAFYATVNLLEAIRTALVNVGLIKGS